MMLIGQGVKPCDRCQFADYHTNLSTSNAVKRRLAVCKMLTITP